ncbi:MAG: hypothetical protein KGM99_07860, partial [Burkholderiales bacterium]|nr:hypothetical protein [Burkholderiales bacterium]
GRELALSFTDQVLPADYEEVSLLFQKRNSYRAFKEWLLSKNQLQNWFQFEALAIKDALHAWCAENSIKLIPERHSSK